MVQNGLKRFKQISGIKAQKNSRLFKKVYDSSKTFKEDHTCSKFVKRFKKVHEGSEGYKKLQDYARSCNRLFKKDTKGSRGLRPVSV